MKTTSHGADHDDSEPMPGCSRTVPADPEAPAAENKDAATKIPETGAGFVKSAALGSLGTLVLGALRQDGPASGRVLAKALGRRIGDVMAACQELRRQGLVRRESKAWHAAPAPRCAGLNAEGGRCGREAAAGSEYCTLHTPAPAPAAVGPRPFLPDGSIAQNNRVAWRYFAWKHGAGFKRTDAGRRFERAYRIRAFLWLKAHDLRMRRMLAADRGLADAIERQLAQEPEAKLSIDGVNAVEFFDLLSPVFDGGEPEEQHAAPGTKSAAEATTDAEPLDPDDYVEDPFDDSEVEI